MYAHSLVLLFFEKKFTQLLGQKNIMDACAYQTQKDDSPRGTWILRIAQEIRIEPHQTRKVFSRNSISAVVSTIM